MSYYNSKGGKTEMKEIEFMTKFVNLCIEYPEESEMIRRKLLQTTDLRSYVFKVPGEDTLKEEIVDKRRTRWTPTMKRKQAEALKKAWKKRKKK